MMRSAMPVCWSPGIFRLPSVGGSLSREMELVLCSGWLPMAPLLFRRASCPSRPKEPPVDCSPLSAHGCESSWKEGHPGWTAGG